MRFRIVDICSVLFFFGTWIAPHPVYSQPSHPPAENNIPKNSQHAADEEDHVLSGIITDKASGKALPGARIAVSESKRGAISDAQGRYRISHLAHNTVAVRVSLIGYKVIVANVDLNTEAQRNFELEESHIETPEVVVSGVSQATEKKRMPLPITILSTNDLKDHARNNIADALSSKPGIDALQSGPALAKPMIRGLGYNRVLVLHDGVRQEEQQWGDEHGVSVDPFSVNTVEILKGPASLMYGSDALAGVVNIMSTHSVNEGVRHLELQSEFSTNNGERAFSVSTDGTYQRWLWDAQISTHSAHSYRNAEDGYVLNSGFNDTAMRAMIGYQGSWGHVNLYASHFALTTGIVEGTRDTSGSFTTERIVNGMVEIVPGTEDDDLSRSPLFPYQRILHNNMHVESYVDLGAIGLYATLGWQQNLRREFADVSSPSQAGLEMDLGTWTYDLHTLWHSASGLELSAGFNGMLQKSTNRGSEFLIPDDQVFDIGAFVLGTIRSAEWDFSAGMRYDRRHTRAFSMYLDSVGHRVDAANGTLLFSDLDLTTPGFSASIGLSRQFGENLTLKANLGRGFRSPSINELSANGVHEGTFRYETGNAALQSETNTQVDLGLLFQNEHLHIELSGFMNDVNNFIFSHSLLGYNGGDSLRESYRVFHYDQASAFLYGAECVIDVHPHPLDWLHIENSFAYVISTMPDQADSAHSLPFTPAPKWNSRVRAGGPLQNSVFKHAELSVGADIYFAQHRIYSAYGTETATPGYALFNIHGNLECALSKELHIELGLGVENLFDAVFQNHLSRLKYTDINARTQKVGVFGMGRRFVAQITIPITW